MRSALAHHLILRYWQDALGVGLAALSLAVGLELALLRPGEGLELSALFGEALEAGPYLIALVTMLAALRTLSRARSEGALIGLQAAGISPARVAAILVLAAAPLVLAAQGLALVPGPAPAVSEATAPALLEGGGLFFRGPETSSGLMVKAAALLPGERRLLFGELIPAERGAASSPQARVSLRVREEWRLDGSTPVAVRADRPWRFTGALVTAPRALLFGARAPRLDLFTLRAWLRLEPERADLRFAFAAALRGGARALVLLLLALASALRAAPDARPLLRAALLAAAYLLLELALAGSGALGELHPELAAFGPLALFGLAALAGLEPRILAGGSLRGLRSA